MLCWGVEVGVAVGVGDGVVWVVAVGVVSPSVCAGSGRTEGARGGCRVVVLGLEERDSEVKRPAKVGVVVVARESMAVPFFVVVVLVLVVVVIVLS